MNASLKRITLIALAAAILLIPAVLTATGIYLNSSAFRQRMLAYANARIDGSIILSAHRFAPLGGRLRLHDLELRGADGTLLLSAEHVGAEISYTALLRRVVHLDSVILDRAFVNLAYDAQDRLMLAQLVGDTAPAAPSSGESSAWQVVIAELNVRQSAIDYLRPAQGYSGRAQGIQLQGRLDLGRSAGQVRMTLDHLSFQGPDRAGRQDGLQIEASYRPGAADPLHLALAAADGRLAFSGAFRPHDTDPRLRGVLDFDLPLSAVQVWLPRSVELAGRAGGRLTLEGSLFDPDADLALTISQGSAFGVPVERLQSAINLRQRQVVIQRFHGQGPWGEAKLDGRIDLRPLFETDFRTFQEASPRYQFTLTAQKLQPDLIPGIDWAWEGIYDVDLQAEGQGWNQPDREGRAQLELAVQQARAVEEGRPLSGSLSAQLQWNDRQVEVTGSRVTLGPNTASVQGHFDFSERQLDARADIALGSLAELGPPLGIEMPAGRSTLRLTASGDLGRPAVHARAEAHDLEYSGWQVQRLETEMRLTTDGVLKIDRLDLQKDTASITGSGSLGVVGADGGLAEHPPISAALNLRNLPPADLGLPQLGGMLNGTLEIGNTLFEPTGRLRLAESPLLWQDMNFNVQGAAVWQAGRLTVSELHLSRAQSDLRITGSVAWTDADGEWTADPLIDVRLETRRLRLQDLAAPYSGTFSAEAQVQGRPDDLHGTFTITGASIDLGVEKADAVSAAGRLTGARIEVEQVTVTLAPGQTLQGKGWYSWDQRFEMVLEADGIDLRTLEVLKPAGPVQGVLRLHVAGTGTLQDPDVEAEAVVAGPRYREQGFDDFHVQARLSGRRLDLSADLNFQLRARADLDGGDFRIEADFAHTDLAPYLSLAAAKALSGRLTGSLDVSGNHRAPLSLNGRLDLYELLVAYQGTSLLSARKVHVGMRDGILDASGVRFDLMQSGYLELNATGDVRSDLSARVAGRLPLTALAVFSETLGEAAGEVALQAEAGGPLGALEWHAEINFEQVGFVIPELLQSVQGLNGRIRLGVNELAVDKLAGRIETGSFTLDGRVGLREWQPVDGRLDLHAQALPLYWPETADFLVSADLLLTGDAREAQLTGDVVLLEGMYYKDFRLNLLAVITESRRASVPAVPPERPEWMRRIGLNIELSHRYPFMVDNNIAQLTVAPDFRIGGTLAVPLIAGRAEIVEGEIIYRRKPFDVTRGVVDFINPYQNEPHLDIAAGTTIGQYEVGLSVSGTPEQLVFTLDSDPPLSDNDILSLILIGRTSEELSAGGGGPSTSQMLSSLIATAWGEDIRQRTGVDILEVETGARSGEPRTSEDRIQVTVGKRLSPRLTVKYEVETTAGERVQRAVSEYRFMENLFAKGFQDTQGKYGGEMLFRLEFR